MKGLLCILIMASSGYIGWYCIGRLHRREKIIGSFISMLHDATLGMKYNGDTLAALFSDNAFHYRFTPAEPFDIQWQRMLEQFRDVLTKEDLSLLREFSTCLGTTDLAGQLQYIDRYTGLLCERKNAVRELIRTKEKIYRILPLSIGTVIVILIL